MADHLHAGDCRCCGHSDCCVGSPAAEAYKASVKCSDCGAVYQGADVLLPPDAKGCQRLDVRRAFSLGMVHIEADGTIVIKTPSPRAPGKALVLTSVRTLKPDEIGLIFPDPAAAFAARESDLRAREDALAARMAEMEAMLAEAHRLANAPKPEAPVTA